MRIAQITDTHIRPLSRHAEYRLVFEELNNRLRAQKPDHIIHTGDLHHTKLQNISPEYISLLTWWLSSLAEIAPTHIVLGNHDGNLASTSRDDAVSPIVRAMDNPRIHLYKRSGVYGFAPGYNWCVFSIFDTEGWDRVKPVAGDVNIAVYHGPVLGAVTEAGWELDGKLNVDFFKEYDVAMLGDIHKQQFLDYREYEFEIDEDDLHRYPGAKVVEP
jgi:predicted phosphodiesterase